MKRALISGITGQDGSYLAELLLEKGYEVHGVMRRSSSFNTDRIEHLYQGPQAKDRKLVLHYGDLNDSSSLNRILRIVCPDEIYNLGAQSHVKVSFDTPEYTGEVTGIGATRLLEATRELQIRPKIYQASSSEMFGLVQETPQRETTPFYPRSPYGVAKVYGHWITVNYRESFGLYAVSGILFNHESPRRGENFVTRKISIAAARISLGLQDTLYLGNLKARRDWGFAPEYVEAIWRIMQQDDPCDLVIATGQSHSVQDFVEAAFEAVNLDWRRHVEVDPIYLRPTEVDVLIGDASLARERLGWEPKTFMPELARIMVEADRRDIEEKLNGTARR